MEPSREKRSPAGARLRSLLRRGFTFLTSAVFAALFSGCGGEEPAEFPSVLRIGLLPDRDPGVLLGSYTPLATCIAKSLGVTAQVRVPGDYVELLRWFEKREIDLAHFGGYTFVVASRDFGAVPLVQRNIDVEFTSLFVARAGEPGPIETFRGRTFAFGSRLSTSGHLMPRSHLERNDVRPESFFSSVDYSGAHDRTLDLVAEGRADLGAVNREAFETLTKTGAFQRSEFTVIAETEPYRDYVWAVQPSFSLEDRRRMREAFLALQPETPFCGGALASIGAKMFIAVDEQDYAPLMAVVDSLPAIEAR